MTGTPAAAGAAESPRVCAVVLNYNYARYVGAAIQSVLDQTHAFDEVIVVNDGSTDASLEVISRFASRVRLIDQPNAGQLSASIAGLAACTSEFVYFLDADDLIAPDALQRLQPALRTAPVKVQFQLSGIDAAGLPLHSVFPSYRPGYAASDMIHDNRSSGFYLSPPTSGNIYRTRFLRDIDLAQFNPRDPVDGVPNLVAPYFGEVVSVLAPLGSYRVHGLNQSLWSTPTVEGLAGEIAWFHRRWQEASKILGAREPALSRDDSLYVTERTLMMRSLDERPVAAAVGAFLRALWRTRAPVLMKAALGGWALAMLCPVGALRRRLVLARRSAGSRPLLVNRAILALKSLAALFAAKQPARLRE